VEVLAVEVLAVEVLAVEVLAVEVLAVEVLAVEEQILFAVSGQTMVTPGAWLTMVLTQ